MMGALRTAVDTYRNYKVGRREGGEGGLDWPHQGMVALDMRFA